MTKNKFISGVVGVAAALVLTGCASSSSGFTPDPPGADAESHALDYYIGKPLTDAVRDASGSHSITDLSNLLGGKPDRQGGSYLATHTTVVAVCGTADTVKGSYRLRAGVVANDLMTPAVVADARAGVFTKDLHCGDKEPFTTSSSERD